MQGEVKITVIATGFGRNRRPTIQPPTSAATDATSIEYRPKPEPPRQPVSEDEDLNIPAFLRNRLND